VPNTIICFCIILQESAIVLARVLLPQKFEKMSMHELRALVAERSTMNIYLRGEVIEIRPNSIGFLLEGFIKTQDLQDLITSPAALLPSLADSNLSYRESSGYQKFVFIQPQFLYCTISYLLSLMECMHTLGMINFRNKQMNRVDLLSFVLYMTCREVKSGLK